MSSTAEESKKSFFSDQEFTCPCCGKVYIDSGLLSILESARLLIQRPIIIDSGYRCQKHNQEVGGVPNSAHCIGEAVDLRCYFAEERFSLIKVFYSLGIRRFGIGKNFLHVDVSKTLPQNVIWLYGEA
jgi:uncharacterized protein YcbK (DUF882 family)